VLPVITFRCGQISDWLNHELAHLQEEMDALEAEGGGVDKEFFSYPFADIEKEALATCGSNPIFVKRNLHGSSDSLSSQARTPRSI